MTHVASSYDGTALIGSASGTKQQSGMTKEILEYQIPHGRCKLHMWDAPHVGYIPWFTLVKWDCEVDVWTENLCMPSVKLMWWLLMLQHSVCDIFTWLTLDCQAWAFTHLWRSRLWRPLLSQLGLSSCGCCTGLIRRKHDSVIGNQCLAADWKTADSFSQVNKESFVAKVACGCVCLQMTAMEEIWNCFELELDKFLAASCSYTCKCIYLVCFAIPDVYLACMQFVAEHQRHFLYEFD